jgi:hypothetical protein
MTGRLKKMRILTGMASDEHDLRLLGYGLMLSIALITAAAAAPPAADPPAADPPARPQTPATAAAPDDSLFEFLGSDDVGDARWWDYLLKTAPRMPPPPKTAAQGTDK